MSLKNHTINMIELTFGTSGKATVDELIDTMRTSPFGSSLMTFSDEEEKPWAASASPPIPFWP